MGDSSSFKHITVTAEPEQDEVIQAGVRPASPTADAAQREEAAVSDVQAAGENDGRARVPAAVEGQPASAEPAQTQDGAPAKQGSDQARSPRVQQKRPDDGYREQTLEDLKSEPMPLTQKVVIVAAVVLIVVAIVYCVFFMG